MIRKTEKIRELIVVEGRNDRNAVARAADADTAATCGFGIREETWRFLEKAYEERGLILLMDPDFSGEEIRRRLNRRFPLAKNAFLAREDALRNGDVGIENASPEAIRAALEAARPARASCEEARFSRRDLLKLRLTGCPEAAARRASLGKFLGIGYGNGAAFLKKLNGFAVSEEEIARWAEENP